MVNSRKKNTDPIKLNFRITNVTFYFKFVDLSSAEISANEAFYKSYANRRLVTTAIDSVTMTTRVGCAMSCLIRTGCQAVNFHDNMCQLTSAPSNESHWVDDVTSNVIILGIAAFIKYY